MKTSFSGEEFAQALASDMLKEPVVLPGMVKKSDDDPHVILFSPGMSCRHWIPIPVKMIDKVDYLGQVLCKDHTHHSVRITLNEPTHQEAKVLASFLGQYAVSAYTLPAQPPTMPAQSTQRFAPSFAEPTGITSPLASSLAYCAQELGCPVGIMCGGKPCRLIDCGTGSCPTCPGLANLVVRAWCSYSCAPSGGAWLLFPRIGWGIIGPYDENLQSCS
jgi:hypothetical protein